MPPDDPVTAAVLAVAADEPRWVEARGLLLSGRGRVVSGDECSSGWVVQSDGDRLSVIVARPDDTELRAAVRDLPAPWRILAHAEAAEALLGSLADWQMHPATIHAHPNGTLPPRPPAPADPPARAIDPADPLLMQHVPAPLRAQLQVAGAHSPVVAAFSHDRPVSFAYAAYETEILWDVSVDTLPDFRGQGYGTFVVRTFAAMMRRRFKRPVWGSLDSNTASLALARKLGFEPVDRLVVFSRG